MTQEITIGRKSDNNVVLNDPFVGRYAAKVIKHEDGHYSIVDLASVNGVYVNGRRISTEIEVIINYEDVIQIGKTSLKLEEIILRGRLGGLSIEEPTIPPPNNAMCYCAPPPLLPPEGRDDDVKLHNPWILMLLIIIPSIILIIMFLII